MTRAWSRREFGRLTMAASLAGAVLAPRAVSGAATAKVVVVGGGPGGATAARHLALGSDKIEVTLVAGAASYATCFFSNLYLGGLRPFETLVHRYDRLAAEHDIRVIDQRAVSLDPPARRVILEDGQALPYDRLVVAPGIDLKFDAIAGYDQAAAGRMPHGWQAGEQTITLKRQLEAMEDGGTVIICPPASPYRCPPGPYERASMIAHYLKRHKPRSKILILDAKDGFSKQALFEDGWARFYPGMIEWLPAEFTGGVTAVDPAAMTVAVQDERFEGAVINVIPPQMAGRIAREADLADDSGWCPVSAGSFASTRHAGVHLIGDAIIPGDMPKSATAANSQARACADAILADLTETAAAEPEFHNVCWSLIAAKHGVKVGADYTIKDGHITTTAPFISDGEESDAVRAETARSAEAWYAAITGDAFGSE